MQRQAKKDSADRQEDNPSDVKRPRKTANPPKPPPKKRVRPQPPPKPSRNGRSAHKDVGAGSDIGNGQGGGNVDGEAPDLDVQPASEGRTERTSWLWRDRLEWGSVAIMQGQKGAGKSTWLRRIVADVTGGERLPGEKGRPRVAGNVLWFAGEEPRYRRVHPGLAAAGADMARVFTADALGEESRTLALPNDCERLRRLILARSIVLVVIDPLFSFLDGTVDIEAGTVPARRFVGQLLRVAAPTGAIILFSRNLTKDTSRGALAAGRGSGELGNAARSVMHVQELPHSPGLYGMAFITNNGRPSPTLTYRIEDSDNGAGVVVPVGTTALTADELCGGEDADLERSNLELAKLLIRQMLPTGEVMAEVVKERAEAASITMRTLQLAAQRLGVQYRREGRRESTVMYWRVPKGGYSE